MLAKKIAAALVGASIACSAMAEDIKVGMVSGLSGPIAETLQEVLKITSGYIDMVNAQGGVNGNRIVLVTKDDEYNVKKTVPLVEEAIASDKVVALVSSAGTAHTLGLIKARTLNKYKVPLVGVFSGAEIIRGPGSEEIFHTRATYHDEVMKIARLASTFGLHKVAVLYQDDAFGQGIMQSVGKGEKEFGLEVVVKAPYKAGTKDFSEQVKQIAAAKPQAIFLLGVPDATYQFMKAYDAPPGAAQLYALSFVTPKLLAEAAGETKIRGFGITQVVPNPNSAVIPLIKEFQEFVDTKYAQGVARSPVALEGYLNVRLLVEALRLAGPRPSGEKVMQALASMRDYRLAGFPIDYANMKRSGSSYLDIAVVGRGGRLLY